MATVIYHDESLIAVAKPSGQFVHATDFDRTDGIPLLQEVRDQIDHYLYPVHRLDRGTSGLVLFALNSETARDLSEIFVNHQIQKRYVALVRGFCDSGTVERPLARRLADGTKGDLQEAQTEYQCIEQFEIPIPSGKFSTTRCSLVSVYPKTGRFHQIRRHMNGINCPVIGDTTHGDSRQNQLFRSQFNVTRLMLAATEIKFCHPQTGTQLHLVNEPDESFANPVESLRQYAVPF